MLHKKNVQCDYLSGCKNKPTVRFLLILARIPVIKSKIKQKNKQKKPNGNNIGSLKRSTFTHKG